MSFRQMTEKELDSMATVQIKPEYAASEVYSTTSEPPPAYKRRSSSVQIAKIVAFTVIASSFIIGCFILASAYLQARASCDQVQALDSVLEKELMLETLQQVNKEIPRAEALIGKENEEADLQHLDKEEPTKKEDIPKKVLTASSATPIPSEPELVKGNDVEQDSSFSESDEADDLQKPQMKVPLELDLSDLAAALLENNQKSRMNCVVERKQAEELVDSPSRTMQLPFGLNLTTDPKKARITGERISIFCESGNEDNKRNEDAEPIRPIFIPLQRFPIPFGPQPQQIPLTHMPQRMIPQTIIREMPSPMIRPMPTFQQIPLRPPVPPQFMQAPRPEMPRYHFQRIPIQEIHLTQIPLAMPNNEINIERVPSENIQQIHIRPLPEGMNIRNLPEGMNIRTLPEGMNIRNLPEGMNIRTLPEGMNIRTLPEGIHIRPLTQGVSQIRVQQLPNNDDSGEIHIQRIQATPIQIQQIQQIQQQQREQNNEETPHFEIHTIQNPEGNIPNQQNPNSEEIHVQNLPLGEALQRIGVTADDLKNIQRIAEEKISELHRLAQEDSSDSSDSDSSDSDSSDSDSSDSANTENKTTKPDDNQDPLQGLHLPSPIDEIMQMGRAMFGRSLVNPIDIPVQMMQSQESSQESSDESERPHFVQPRSVNNAENVFGQGEKRFKRCACDCNC